MVFHSGLTHLDSIQTLAFVFEWTTRLLGEPRMRDQSVGRFADRLQFAGQSLGVVVLSGGRGDLLDVRREGESAVLTCQASGWAVVVVETTNERGEHMPDEWMGGRGRRNGRRVRVDVVVA